jgi:hypothetical protein
MSLGTILLVILILMLLGVIPTWPHSRSWGYGPAGGLGLVLIIVIVLLLLDGCNRCRSHAPAVVQERHLSVGTGCVGVEPGRSRTTANRELRRPRGSWARCSSPAQHIRWVDREQIDLAGGGCGHHPFHPRVLWPALSLPRRSFASYQGRPPGSAGEAVGV